MSAMIVTILAGVPSRAGGSQFWGPHATKPDHARPAAAAPLIAEGAELGVAAQSFAVRALEASQRHNLRDMRLYRTLMATTGERAIDRLERALALEPDNASVHFAVARYLYEFVFDYYAHDVPRPMRRNDAGRRALTHWKRFEQLSPYDPRRVHYTRHGVPTPQRPGATAPLTGPYQFARSIVYATLGGEDSYRRAIDDDDYCLATAPAGVAPPAWIAQLLTNSAEMLMAIGHLDEAIDRYERAVRLDADPLYLYGLAVAYDRKGLADSAMDAMREGMSRDTRGPLGSLARDTVFFVPPGDIDYYRALGREAQGDRAGALALYRRFLTHPATRRYASRADRHIRQLTHRRATTHQRHRK